MNFKFVLLLIYIYFDIRTKFKVNQTQIGNSIPQETPKITRMALSQNLILPKCHSPKSLLLHFSMNLSETFRINVNSKSLYIIVIVNEGQNKFEVQISKRFAKMVINWHKIDQMPLLGKNIKLA